MDKIEATTDKMVCRKCKQEIKTTKNLNMGTELVIGAALIQFTSWIENGERISEHLGNC